MTQEEKIKHVQESILKACEAFQILNDLILGILATNDAPLINHFLIKTQIGVNAICDAYFQGFEPEAKRMITEHVRSTMPNLASKI